MARVRLIKNSEADGDLKQIYEIIEARGASIHNAHRALAHNPIVLRNFMRLGVALLTTTELAPRLRELAIIRIAKATGCDYEWSSHHPIALQMGVTEEQAQHVINWQNANCYSPEEKAVLRYVDEVAGIASIGVDTFNNLRGFLNERSVVELTLVVGFYRMVARFVQALDIEMDHRPDASISDLLGRR